MELGFTISSPKISSKISDVKLTAGIFIGPQIRELLCDQGFSDVLNVKELAAWNGFKLVVSNFLGNHRAENYEQLIDDMFLSLP